MILVTEGVVNIKLPRDEFLGEAIIELTDIISRPYAGASMLPDLCMVTYGRRLLVGESKEEILEAIKNTIAQTSKGAPQLNATVEYCHGRATCYTGARISAEKYSPAWLASGDSQLVKTALSALAGISLEPKLGKYSFCTNSSKSAANRHIPTIGFGPSRENLAHITNEYIKIEQLLKAAQGYATIADEILK